MADAAPRSFVSSLGGLLTGVAAVITASVAAYNLYKRDRPATPQTTEVRVESFEAQPLQIAPGEALVLRWRSEHARTCGLEPGIGAVGANGTRTVKPAEDTTYTLRCHGEQGEDERTVSVSVVARSDIGREEPPPEPLIDGPSPGVREPATDVTEDASGGSPDFAGSLPPQDLAYHCCDMYGNQRCVLVAPVLVGSGCFCPYQGTGISCP